MLVRVSQPHIPSINFTVSGSIPVELLEELRRMYGNDNVKEDDNAETVDPFEEDWFKSLEAESTPGSELRFYRKLNNMTQAQLASEIGITKNAVSAMEHNARAISKKMAKTLAVLFRTSPARFL